MPEAHDYDFAHKVESDNLMQVGGHSSSANIIVSRCESWDKKAKAERPGKEARQQDVERPVSRRLRRQSAAHAHSRTWCGRM